MSELTIAFHRDNVSSIGKELRAGFRALAEELDESDLLDINVQGLTWQHDKWEHGEPCPECGSEKFHCGQIEYAIYEATDEGDMTFTGERGAPLPSSDFTEVTCNNASCMAELYRGPASCVTKNNA